MSVEFRMANLSDVDQLARLRVLMQLEVNKIAENCVPPDYLEKVRQFLEKSLRENKYYAAVAVSEERIVANAGVCFYEKPPTISGGSGLNGYVTNVFTLKEYRNKGIARQLMIQLSKLAQQMKADKLHLGATADGIGVYQSVGYKPPKYVNLDLLAPFIDPDI